MSDNKIIAEAKERFKRCQTHESAARANWQSDMAFCYGDSINLAQWDDDTIDSRTASGKPCFTVNRTRNYVMQIVNDAKQNKAQIEVRAVGGGASFQCAEVIEGIVRHIEYISNSTAAYEQACHDQVAAGVGYWRVTTDYASDDSFDTEIFIKPIKDSLSVYLDPYIQQADGSDATFGFVFTDMDKDDFSKSYPRYKEAMSSVPFSMEITADDMWEDDNRIRVAEYFRKVNKADVLHYLPTGETIRESAVAPERMEQLQQLSIKSRDIQVPQVEWYCLAGDKIVDRGTFPSRYIPIVRCVGLEVTLSGQYDRIGHVRTLRDAQKAYNWFTSSGIEFVAAQSRSPWLADIASIDGLETYWRDSNIKNYSVLPYKGVADDGARELEPPRRADPPVYAAAFLDGLKVAASEMELVSGQPPAVMGEQGNERSGKGILERQRSAANSYYHFVNNLSSAIRFTGKILIDMICNNQVYDTPRIMKILSQSGAMQTVQLDPNQQAPHVQQQGLDHESMDAQHVALCVNPTVGTYDVVAETGPQYTTRRQEFVAATMDILAQNESLTPVIGDLVFANMDFPGAQEISERMRRMVPPQALGQTDPQVQQLQQQLAQQHMFIQQMAQELQEAKHKANSIAMQKDIDFYEAQTKRFGEVGKIDPQALRPIIREMVSEIMNQPVNQVIGMHMAEDVMMTKHAKQIEDQIDQAMQPQQPPGPNGQAPGGQ